MRRAGESEPRRGSEELSVVDETEGVKQDRLCRKGCVKGKATPSVSQPGKFASAGRFESELPSCQLVEWVGGRMTSAFDRRSDETHETRPMCRPLTLPAASQQPRSTPKAIQKAPHRSSTLCAGQQQSLCPTPKSSPGLALWHFLRLSTAPFLSLHPPRYSL